MRCMHIQQFDPRAIPLGKKEALYLEVAQTPGGMPILQTALTVAGTAPGPVLFVVGGIHGDEYEGPLAIMRLFRELEPADMRGTFVGLTVANTPAFEAASRETPVDGRNLNRAFPGNVRGSLTEQIAYWLGERLISRADCCIDLHSGGSNWELATLCGYQIGSGPVADLRRQVAEAFRAPVCMAYKEHLASQAMGYAAERGVATVFTECTAQRRTNMQAAEIYQRGVRNAMRVLGMWGGVMEGDVSPHYLLDAGNPEHIVHASTSGFFVPAHRFMERVEVGELVGTILDLAGQTLEELRAPTDGFILSQQVLPAMQAGSVVFTMVQEYHAEAISPDA